METIKRTVLIDAPTSVVWSALANFQGIGDFHPYITNVDLLSKNNGGIGSKRTCFFSDGTKIDEEIIEWHDGERFTIKASNFSFPIKTMKAALGVTPAGSKSEAFMTIMYEPKYGLMGKLMALLMMNRMMGKRMAGILAGLGQFATTGKRVDRAA